MSHVVSRKQLCIFYLFIYLHWLKAHLHVHRATLKTYVNTASQIEEVRFETETAVKLS